MIVDSYRFLPRSFVGMYDAVEPAPGDAHVVWAPFERRLADAAIALVTSAGLYVANQQEPFDLDRERAEPTWGDPSYREIPHGTRERLGMSHLHVNADDILADRNVALPVDVLDTLVSDGRVGRAAAAHASVMGFQAAGLHEWRTTTAPAIIDLLRAQETTGVVLAPV